MVKLFPLLRRRFRLVPELRYNRIELTVKRRRVEVGSEIGFFRVVLQKLVPHFNKVPPRLQLVQRNDAGLDLPGFQDAV